MIFVTRVNHDTSCALAYSRKPALAVSEKSQKTNTRKKMASDTLHRPTEDSRMYKVQTGQKTEKLS